MRNATTDTVALFGLPISNVTLLQVIARVEEHVVSYAGRTHQIATANLGFAREALRDPELKKVVCECSLVLPDGGAMLWAAALCGISLQERVTTAHLLPELAHLSALRGYRLFWLGSSQGSAEEAIETIKGHAPGAKIAGWYSAAGSLTERDDEEILRRISAARPDILIVALGSPWQERWIYAHRERLGVPVAIGVSESPDRRFGPCSRLPGSAVPLPIGRVVRTLQQLAELAPGFLGDLLALTVHLPLGLLARCLQPGERRHGGLKVDSQDDVKVINTPAKLSGGVCGWLVREAELSAAEQQAMILDMSATVRVEADGLGALLEARRILLGEEQSLWLTGMSQPVRRVLHFSAMADLFRTAATVPEAQAEAGASDRASKRPAASAAGLRKRPGRADSRIAKAS